jgi:hypothetical protein
MNYVIAIFAAVVLMNDAALAAEECEVPPSMLSSESDLTHVISEIKDQHRVDISVVGTGSSSLPGADGASFAYPARLEAALRQRLSGVDVKVTAHVSSRQTAAEMIPGLKGIMVEDKPALVIWQVGTFDAVRGIEPEEFRNKLDEGVDILDKAGADVDLMNMQYSPRTDSVLGVAAYADVMRWVAQQHGALLFDRLAVMRYWNDEGTFDLYAATKNYDMARRVHDCIGRALASQIINAAHLTP